MEINNVVKRITETIKESLEIRNKILNNLAIKWLLMQA